MGTPGVPFKVKKERILESIKKYRGVISSICKDLDYSHETILRHIRKDPMLSHELDAARNAFDDLLCDMAEDSLRYAVAQKEDLASALSSAKFILNNKGKKRGYTPNCMTTGIVENFSQLQSDAVAGKIKQEEIVDKGNSQ